MLPFFSDKIRLIRFNSLYEREMIVEISVDKLGYMHSFALSENYAILFNAPLVMNPTKVIKVGVPDSMEWDKSKPLELIIVNIHSGESRKIKTKPLFGMHFANAYEEGNLIHIDYCMYPDFTVIQNFHVEKFLDPKQRNDIPNKNQFLRYTINLDDNTVKTTDFSTTYQFEFPVINEAYRHKKYCYVYGTSFRHDNVHWASQAIVKKNMCEPNKDVSWIVENHYPSEPWFVASPDAKTEDDGLLFSVVLDGENAESYLAVFDPKDMTLINKSKAPFHIPFRIHGRFYD